MPIIAPLNYLDSFMHNQLNWVKQIVGQTRILEYCYRWTSSE